MRHRRESAPWEAWIADDMEYVHEDPHAWLTGQFTPTVRKGFGKLPSGGYVIPVGDTAITFDPVCGQGGNFTNRSPKFISDVIFARGDLPYDEAWMDQVNKDMWDNFGGVAYTFNTMFLEPFDATAQLVLDTAAESEAAGDVMNERDFPVPLAPLCIAAASTGVPRWGCESPSTHSERGSPCPSCTLARFYPSSRRHEQANAPATQKLGAAICRPLQDHGAAPCKLLRPMKIQVAFRPMRTGRQPCLRATEAVWKRR